MNNKTIHPLNVIPAQDFDKVGEKLGEAWNQFMELQGKMEYHAQGSGGLMKDNLDDFRKAINDAHRIVITMRHAEISLPNKSTSGVMRDGTNEKFQKPLIMKYIIATQDQGKGQHEVFFTSFSDNIVHSIMFSQLISVVAHQENAKKSSSKEGENRKNFTSAPLIARTAGFIDRNGRFFGESTSLGLKAGKGDQLLMAHLDAMFGTYSWRISENDLNFHFPAKELTQDEQSAKDVESGLKGE